MGADDYGWSNVRTCSCSGPMCLSCPFIFFLFPQVHSTNLVCCVVRCQDLWVDFAKSPSQSAGVRSLQGRERRGRVDAGSSALGSRSRGCHSPAGRAVPMARQEGLSSASRETHPLCARTPLDARVAVSCKEGRRGAADHGSLSHVNSPACEVRAGLSTKLCT
jgi:hypothetical protein